MFNINPVKAAIINSILMSALDRPGDGYPF
jgi:hypothetical protein